MKPSEDKAREYLDNINASVRYARNVFWPRCAELRQLWRYSCLATELPLVGADLQLASVSTEFVRSAVIMPVVEAQVAGLMPRNPKTRAVPRKEFFDGRVDGKDVKLSSDKTVPVIEKISDYDIEQCDLRSVGKRALRDSRLLGMGCIEVGWDPWFGKTVIEKRQIQDGDPNNKETVKTNLRYQEYIRKASPYYRYRRAEDVLLPAFIADAKDAPFLILRNRRILYEAVADPNYDIVDPKEIEQKAGFSWLTDDGYASSAITREMQQGPSRMCLEYHVWNRADNVYAVYIDGLNDPVRWDEWPFDVNAVDGFPLKLNIPMPADNNPYGVSPMAYLVPQQREMNKVRSRMAEITSKWRTITMANEDAAPEEIDRIKRAEEGSIVKVENIKNYANFPADMNSLQYLLMYEQRIREDVRVQSNVTDFQLAGSPDTNFATDSALMAQAQSARAEDERVAVRKFLADTVKFGFQLRQELMTDEQSVKITGENAGWLRVSPEQIVGEYDFHLEIEEAPSDRAQAKEAATAAIEGFYGKPEADGTEVLKFAAKQLRMPPDIIKGTDQFASRREAEYENEMLLNMDPAAEMIRPHPQENAEIHIQSHQEAMQRAQQEGRDPGPLAQHLQMTMQMAQMAEKQGGSRGAGGARPQAGGAPGQVRMSGKMNQGNPVERVRSGDVGALRGISGAR